MSEYFSNRTQLPFPIEKSLVVIVIWIVNYKFWTKNEFKKFFQVFLMSNSTISRELNQFSLQKIILIFPIHLSW